MMQDIFLPTKIGSYYLFKKRVLGIEITTSSIQASLIYFSRKSVTLENSMTIALQDQNSATIVQAIKKIATTIGLYDEVITCLTSSAVVFKELTLPFIGREKISMIVRYEVEPLLPFPLEQAVVDFLITDENKEKSQTTILVAAARKSDVEMYTDYFEKAGVQLTKITLDMFALYDFYRNAMYVAQAYTSLLLVDFGIDAIRILYIQKGVLKSVRLVPYGLIAMMKKADESLQSFSDNAVESILQEYEQGHDQEKRHKITEQLLVDFSKQITLSVSFFQKQIKNFITPAKIVCLGTGTQLQDFSDQATQLCHIPVELLDIKRFILKNNIQVNRKIKIDKQHSTSLIIPLSTTQYSDVNFLSDKQQALQSSLLNKQLLTLVLISVATLAGIYFYSNYQLKKWHNDYEKSRKQMVGFLQEQMDVDSKNVKRVHDIIASAQSKLQQTKKVCLSFSQTSNNYLHYLQEIFNKIDKESLELDLKKMSIHGKEIILQGKVKNFDALRIFTEELLDLKDFTLKNIPAELSFNVTLLMKDDQHNQGEQV